MRKNFINSIFYKKNLVNLSDFIELKIMLNLERDEYTAMNPVVRARMTIHSPNIVPNPQYDGVSLQPGRTYNYGVRKVF